MTTVLLVWVDGGGSVHFYGIHSNVIFISKFVLLVESTCAGSGAAIIIMDVFIA